jgi:hypothetical protein
MMSSTTDDRVGSDVYGLLAHAPLPHWHRSARAFVGTSNQPTG